MHRARLLITRILFLLLLLPGARAAAARANDATAASIDMLRRAATPQRNGGHLPLLFALRQLRDPELEPFFRGLLTSEDWQTQVQAVLGLAELSADQRIDPASLFQADAAAQEAIITTGLDLHLLASSQIPELLASDELGPMARVFLIAEQVLIGQAPDREDLAGLAASTDDHLAGLAALLLAQAGDAAPLLAYRSRLAALEPAQRVGVSLWLIEAARRYRLTATKEWIATILDDPAIDPDLAYRAIFAMLALDQPAGLRAWDRFLASEDNYSHRVRYALLLLASGKDIPAGAYGRIRAADDEDLLEQIITTGRALSSGTDPAEAIIPLLDLGHARTLEWALEYLDELPPEQSARVYAHALDQLSDPATSAGDTVALGVEATAKLYAIDADAVLQRLRKAEDDGLAQQAILLGLFETHDARAGEAAAKLRRIGSGRADSLALILMARPPRQLEAEDRERLGQIASGAGRVSDLLQVQAAWLYLRHTGKTGAALAAVVPALPAD